MAYFEIFWTFIENIQMVMLKSTRQNANKCYLCVIFLVSTTHFARYDNNAMRFFGPK